MRTKILLIFGLLALAYGAKAQTRLHYGIGLNFNAPLVNQKSTGFSSNGGLGAGLFLERSFNSRSMSLSNKLQFNSVSYYSPATKSNFRSDNYEAYLGLKSYFPKLDSSALFFHLVPSYATLTTRLTGQTGGASQRNRLNYTSHLNHAFDLGFNPGIEIRLSDRVALEVSTLIYLNSTARDSFIDGRPNMIKLGLNLAFGGQDNSGSLRQQMNDALLNLSNDTLYVVNRSCSKRLNDSLLYELFSRYYDHSAFRVIKNSEIEGLSKKNQAHFFAIVGELFGGESEPESSGIYLLNSEFELCGFPYPVLTTYRDPMGAPCFDNLSITSQTIMMFNKKLVNRS